ncbi:MAG: hypothetical protein IJO56_06235 [Oscillospiraceae bacterium]|nr:hypothetical protein [Oscillospiraceae bacterium]
MNTVFRYLLSVIAAAMIISILLGLIDKKSAQFNAIRLLCGVFLSASVLSPLIDLKLDDLQLYTHTVMEDAQSIAAYGVSMAQTEKNSIIKEKAETYILNKAAAMGATVTVTVSIGQEEGIPESISLRGNVSPLIMARLSRIIEEDLGIAEEDQMWISAY